MRINPWLRLPPRNIVRAVAAGFLALLAIIIALLPGQKIVVVTRDLAPGIALTANDLRVIEIPAAARPAGAIQSVAAATGKALASAARAGEPLTDFRLVSMADRETTVAVPLANPGVVPLLQPGSRVDVIDSTARTLASQATVVTISDNKLIIISTGRENARQVAAVSLDQPLTVTLR